MAIINVLTVVARAVSPEKHKQDVCYEIEPGKASRVSHQEKLGQHDHHHSQLNRNIEIFTGVKIV